MDKPLTLTAVLVIISFALSAFLYPQLPAQLATHWNAVGDVDGHMPKVVGLFLLPVIVASVIPLLVLLPQIDPMKANVDLFRVDYHRFIAAFTLFILYMHSLTLIYNIGWKFNMIQFMSPALGILFFVTGGLLAKSKRNWFIGIRTPWTLSDDTTWDNTHKIGAKMFKACGVTAAAGALMPQYAIILILVPILATTAYTVIYSYLEYRKLAKK